MYRVGNGFIGRFVHEMFGHTRAVATEKGKFALQL